MLAAEPVAELEHAALAVGEVLERLPQRLLGEQLRGAVEGDSARSSAMGWPNSDFSSSRPASRAKPAPAPSA